MSSSRGTRVSGLLGAQMRGIWGTQICEKVNLNGTGPPAHPPQEAEL
jgi:hypothetical protein